jgi:hypothetical protein
MIWRGIALLVSMGMGLLAITLIVLFLLVPFDPEIFFRAFMPILTVVVCVLIVCAWIAFPLLIQLKAFVIRHERVLKVFFASLPAGALIGLAFGFAERGSRTPLFGYSGWLRAYSADALFWAVAGAFVAGMAVYVWRLLHSD